MDIGGANVTAKPRRDLSDEELRAVARWVARTQLEVERGHRPAKALRAVLAAHLYHALEHAHRPAGAPPVAAGDVGNASFHRLTTTTGYAVVVVRETDGRWEALTMVLRRNDRGVWHFIDIVRASQYTSTRQAEIGRLRSQR